MLYCKVVIFVLSLIVLSKSEIIEIDDGKLEGTVLQTRKGVNFNAFLKIPYAEPPIESLRFQSPIANKKWNGILNATTHGPICMQFQFDSIYGKSEDCLHLNVFTKNLRSNDLKPVIFFIHGGGFESGSASTHKAEYLLDRDIVLVTINYRLGPFGFLALGTKDVVGNMGLKDQALALKWVQKNIAKFGGDPNLVTIAGLSAGGMSVTAHLVSDMSRGLFHRAIAMSGAITWQKGLQTNNIPMATELAKRLNCATNVSTLIQCLNTKTSYEISKAGTENYYNCPLMEWVPVIEPNLGQERFLIDDPNELFKNGNFSRVPVMIGITADEFVEQVSYVLTDKNALQQLNKNFTAFAPKCFFFSGNKKNSAKKIAKELRNYYLPFEEIDSRSFNSLKLLLADGTIGYGVHRFTRFASLFTDVYYYKFTYIGRFSMFHFPRSKPYGAHHVDDIQYLFETTFIGPKINETDPESFMVERMTRIWEQFAKFGDPNNQSDEYLVDMIWPKHDLDEEYFMDIGSEMVEKQGLYLERFSVWDGLEKSSGHRFHDKFNIFWLIMFGYILKIAIKTD